MNNGYGIQLPQMGGQMHPLNTFHFQQGGNINNSNSSNMGFHGISNLLDIPSMHGNSVITPPIPSPSPSSSPISNSLPPIMQQQQQVQQHQQMQHHQQQNGHSPQQHHQQQMHQQQMHHQMQHHQQMQQQAHHQQQMHHQMHQQIQQQHTSQQQTPQPSPQHTSNAVSSILSMSGSVPSSDSIQSPIYEIPHSLLAQAQQHQLHSSNGGNNMNSSSNNIPPQLSTSTSTSSTTSSTTSSIQQPAQQAQSPNINNVNNNPISSPIDEQQQQQLQSNQSSTINSPKTKSKKSKSSSSSKGSKSSSKVQPSTTGNSPLENSLNSLTKEQLVQLVTHFLEVDHPDLIQEFENAMPPPDLHDIMEELDDLQKKYNKLYPNNKFCYDNQSYNRVKSGLASFKKALVEYGDNFKEKNGWATLLQYVILAIPYALRMPLWDDEKNNASRVSALSKMDVFGKAAVKGLLQNDIPLEKWERHRSSLNPHAFYLKCTIEEIDKCIEKRRKKEEKTDKQQSKKRKKPTTNNNSVNNTNINNNGIINNNNSSNNGSNGIIHNNNNNNSMGGNINGINNLMNSNNGIIGMGLTNGNDIKFM